MRMDVWTTDRRTLTWTANVKTQYPAPNVWRGIKMKVELQFLFSAHRLIVLYIYTKFHENVSKDFRVIERTQFCDRQTDRQTHGENNMSSLLSGADKIV